MKWFKRRRGAGAQENRKRQTLMSILIGTWLMGRTKWGKTQGTGGDLISLAWWKWSVPRLIQDRAMRDWKIARAPYCSLQFYWNSIHLSKRLSASLCFYSGQSHTHTHKLVHDTHISAISNTHTHSHAQTQAHTEGSFFSEWSVFSVQSSLFDTEPFCTCSRACTEDVEDEWRNTHIHTPYKHTHAPTYIHWLWLAWMVWVLRRWCNSLQHSVRAEPSCGDYWYGWHRQGHPEATAGFSFS